MPDGRLLTLVSPAARTATFFSDVEDVDPAEGLAVTLDVTAASGTTPTLNVLIEDAPNANGPWTTLLTFAQKTAAATEVQRSAAANFHSYLRARCTIAGTTPSFTFSVQATVR